MEISYYHLLTILHFPITKFLLKKKRKTRYPIRRGIIESAFEKGACIRVDVKEIEGARDLHAGKGHRFISHCCDYFYRRAKTWRE